MATEVRRVPSGMSPLGERLTVRGGAGTQFSSSGPTRREYQKSSDQVCPELFR